MLVRLSSGELVTKIFKEKKRFTSFSLADLNPSLLGESSIKNIKQTNIFINYYLKKDQYKEFTQLRAYAKTIGFKYVWHNGKKFLTKMGDGAKTFTFVTKTDLKKIMEHENQNHNDNTNKEKINKKKKNVKAVTSSDINDSIGDEGNNNDSIGDERNNNIVPEIKQKRNKNETNIESKSKKKNTNTRKKLRESVASPI